MSTKEEQVVILDKLSPGDRLLYLMNDVLPKLFEKPQQIKKYLPKLTRQQIAQLVQVAPDIIPYIPSIQSTPQQQERTTTSHHRKTGASAPDRKSRNHGDILDRSGRSILTRQQLSNPNWMAVFRHFLNVFQPKYRNILLPQCAHHLIVRHHLTFNDLFNRYDSISEQTNNDFIEFLADATFVALITQIKHGADIKIISGMFKSLYNYFQRLFLTNRLSNRKFLRFTRCCKDILDIVSGDVRDEIQKIILEGVSIDLFISKLKKRIHEQSSSQAQKQVDRAILSFLGQPQQQPQQDRSRASDVLSRTRTSGG